MNPRQEIWVGDGDELSFVILDEAWFAMSRGTLILPIRLDSGQDALLRQHGGESLWYQMIAEIGMMDELPGSKWTIARADDGSWLKPGLNEKQIELDSD